jgi:hypothetical protein
LIAENADLDALRRRRRAKEQSACCHGEGRELDYPHGANHIPLPCAD